MRKLKAAIIGLGFIGESHIEAIHRIGICELSNADVVRHVMVQRIVKAYEDYETAKNGGKGKK